MDQNQTLSLYLLRIQHVSLYRVRHPKKAQDGEKERFLIILIGRLPLGLIRMRGTSCRGKAAQCPKGIALSLLAKFGSRTLSVSVVNDKYCNNQYTAQFSRVCSPSTTCYRCSTAAHSLLLLLFSNVYNLSRKICTNFSHQIPPSRRHISIILSLAAPPHFN